MPSIGKYIRYHSLMEYHRFQGYLNNADDQYQKNNLIDIDFPNGWVWSSDINICNEKSLGGQWSCIFRSIKDSIPSPDKLHKLSHINLVSFPQI